MKPKVWKIYNPEDEYWVVTTEDGDKHFDEWANAMAYVARDQYLDWRPSSYFFVPSKDCE